MKPSLDALGGSHQYLPFTQVGARLADHRTEGLGRNRHADQLGLGQCIGHVGGGTHRGIDLEARQIARVAVPGVDLLGLAGITHPLGDAGTIVGGNRGDRGPEAAATQHADIESHRLRGRFAYLAITNGPTR